MNPLLILGIVVSIATLVMLSINVYLMMQVKNERKKSLLLKQNVGALAVMIQERMDQHKSGIVLTNSQKLESDNLVYLVLENLIKIKNLS